MRTRPFIMMAALLLLSATLATAQSDVLPSRPPGVLDFGIRFTDVTGDQARYQRYRDLGDGGFFEQFRWGKEQEGMLFEVGGDHIGRLDQRFFGEYRSLGTVSATFEWNQIPTFISQDTRTLYTESAPGVLVLPNGMASAIQNKTATLATFAPNATGFDTKSRRDAADFNLVYTATRDLDVKVGVKYTKRNGTMPFGASFGSSPGSTNAVEVAAPIDTRTTDISAGVEWANRDGMLRVGYDGSWFTNNVPSLTWDNPWMATATAGSLSPLGRLALAPSSNSNAVSTSGSIKFPGHSRFAGSVAVGSLTQNASLLPFTINPAIPVTPLERTTAEGDARTIAMNYVFTSRPTSSIWVDARYRFNDFDNRTPEFTATAPAVFDQTVAAASSTEPYSLTRKTFDVDVSFTPVRYTAFKVGYGRETIDRTFRIFATTNEDTARASIDTTGLSWVTFRAIYEHSKRRGSGFDQEMLVDASEQPDMRHFDVADRDRDRLTGLVQVTPAEFLSFSASAGYGKDDYIGSGFGLRNNKNQVYNIGFDLTPKDSISFSLSYDYEKYTALLNSRTSSPGVQFTDPTRNWSDDTSDRVHGVTASLDLLKIVPDTEVRLGYDWNRARDTYVYSLAPNSAVATPQQLPPIVNELQSAFVDLRYFFTKKLALGVVYRFDKYNVNDFALGTDTLNRLDLAGGLFLGYVYRPYTANGAWLRVLYYF